MSYPQVSMPFLSMFMLLVLCLCGATAATDESWRRMSELTPEGFSTLSSVAGRTIRYKELWRSGIACETTPGVRSFAGFIDMAADSHSWFWFFESRSDPAADPITLWLNGGPGSDSSIGLFEEIGPCTVSADLKTHLNLHSWSGQSNLLILSQPIGVGFSHSTFERGTLNPISGVFQPAHINGTDGSYYPTISDAVRVRTTAAAARRTWALMQTFLAALPALGSRVTPARRNTTTLHLFTESYGGHYGPAFFRHFKEQIDAASPNRTHRYVLGTLGIMNGLVDLAVQVPSYAAFLRSHPHGLHHVLNDSLLQYMDFALLRPGGCLASLADCHAADRTTDAGHTICASAATLCRADVETMYQFSGRDPYDVRHRLSSGNDTDRDGPDDTYFVRYLNQPATQSALGVPSNTYYAAASQAVYWDFAASGDLAAPDFLADLVWLVNGGVRVALAYGDADYECNWIGGEAVAEAVAAAADGMANIPSCVPFVVDLGSGHGTTYGCTREWGPLLSFTRIFDAGHKVPWYQPRAMQAWHQWAMGDSHRSGGITESGATEDVRQSSERSSAASDCWDVIAGG